VNPGRGLFEHLAASALARAAFIGSMLVAVIGGLGVAFWRDAPMGSTVFMAITAGLAAVALAIAAAAWVSAVADDVDASRRRVSTSVRWLVGAVVALIAAAILR
jgi:hypothetical protein